jgi:hypothetical protein
MIDEAEPPAQGMFRPLRMISDLQGALRDRKS